jgi:antitoxin Phd
MMPTILPSPSVTPWRLQDAKSQFSAVVDNALRGVPQHVTRRGQRAVVVLSEADFEALQRSAAGQAATRLSLIDHLLTMPSGDGFEAVRLDVQPRKVDFS